MVEKKFLVRPQLEVAIPRFDILLVERRDTSYACLQARVNLAEFEENI